MILFFVLPSRVFDKDQQGIAYVPILYLFFYIFLFKSYRQLKLHPFPLAASLVFLIFFSGGLSYRIVREQLTYKGTHIPMNDAPLEHRLKAVAYIAKRSSGNNFLAVAYDFQHSNRARLEEEYKKYVAQNPFGAMASGRLYDAEFLMHYRLKNRNDNFLERSGVENDFLITYNFVSQQNLPQAWRKQQLTFHDFGRIRVYEKNSPLKKSRIHMKKALEKKNSTLKKPEKQ
jgi:hypothetical protein